MSAGAHLSKSKLDSDIIESEAEISQIFVSNPRGYQHPSEKVLAGVKSENGIYIHLPYLVNPASENPDVREKSLNLILATDKINDSRLKGIVVHGGQGGKNSTVEEAIDRWVNLLKGVDFKNKLLVENTAGGNAAPGRGITTHIELVKRLGREHNIGICYDTCHGFASGSSGMVDDLLKIKSETGVVDLIHLNDSRDLHGSGRDRHELLGRGSIGMDILSKVVKHAKSDNIDLILETPGDNIIWREELKIIKSL